MSAGLLDTSVVIDWDDRAVSTALPDEAAISAVTLAELTAGPHLTAAVTNELAGRLACSKSRRPSTPSSSTPLLPAVSMAKLPSSLVARKSPRPSRTDRQDLGGPPPFWRASRIR